MPRLRQGVAGRVVGVTRRVDPPCTWRQVGRGVAVAAGIGLVAAGVLVVCGALLVLAFGSGRL